MKQKGSPIDNPKDCIFELISNYDQSQTKERELYEDVISANFIDCIKNDKLLELPLPVIDRILTKYQLNNHNQTGEEVINFLFKCFVKFGRPASDQFDFYYINKACYKSMYDNINDLMKKVIELEIKQAKMYESFQEENKQLRNEIDKMKEIQEENKKIRNEFQEENNKLKNKIQEENLKIKNEIQEESKNIVKKLESNFNEKIDQLKKTISDQKSLISQLTSQVELFKKQPISRFFTDEKNPKGIIAYLKDKVTITAGGNHEQGYLVDNIRNDDNNYFFNYYEHKIGTTEEDGSLTFDFGSELKIDLYSYLIRSNGWPANGESHAKSWRIMGSNDKINWILLDKRENETALKGSYFKHHFICQEKKFGNTNNRFRYVRFIQDANYTFKGLNNRCIYITYFELYGDIYQ